MATRIRTTLLVAIASLALVAAACGDDDDDGNGGDVGPDTVAEDGGMDADAADGADVEPDGEMDADAADMVADVDGAMPDAPECELSDTQVNVEGQGTIHPASQSIDESPNLGGAAVTMIGANEALNGNIVALKQQNCSDAVFSYPSDLMDAEADWSLDNVDVGDLIIALVGLIDDAPDSGEDNFVPTATGLATTPVEEDQSGLQAFGVTQNTEEALSSLVAPHSEAVEGNPGDLIGAGFVLGRFLDQQGNPMEGVQVVANGSPVDSAVYPNSDYSDSNSGTDASTSQNGVFIIPQADLAQYTGQLEEGDGPSFSTQQAKSPEGVAFTVTLNAQSE